MKYLKFLISIAICEGVGALAGIITAPSISSWYQTLAKLAFNPPNWIFPVVWNFLFFLMGVALFLVWEKGKRNPSFRIALEFFALQLFLNFFWSILFFKLQNPALALLEIFILWFSIIFTILYFFRINRLAAFLLFPYVLWVTFAIFLNYLIWKLN